MVGLKQLEPYNNCGRWGWERFGCHRLLLASGSVGADLFDMELHNLWCASFVEGWRVQGGRTFRRDSGHDGNLHVYHS